MRYVYDDASPYYSYQVQSASVRAIMDYAMRKKEPISVEDWRRKLDADGAHPNGGQFRPGTRELYNSRAFASLKRSGIIVVHAMIDKIKYPKRGGKDRKGVKNSAQPLNDGRFTITTNELKARGLKSDDAIAAGRIEAWEKGFYDVVRPGNYLRSGESKYSERWKLYPEGPYRPVGQRPPGECLYPHPKKGAGTDQENHTPLRKTELGVTPKNRVRENEPVTPKNRVNGDPKGPVSYSDFRSHFINYQDSGQGVEGGGSLPIGQPKTKKKNPRGQATGDGGGDPAGRLADLPPRIKTIVDLAERCASWKLVEQYTLGDSCFVMKFYGAHGIAAFGQTETFGGNGRLKVSYMGDERSLHDEDLEGFLIFPPLPGDNAKIEE